MILGVVTTGTTFLVVLVRGTVILESTFFLGKLILVEVGTAVYITSAGADLEETVALALTKFRKNKNNAIVKP